MRVLERNASDGVNPIILIQFGSLYLTRLKYFDRENYSNYGVILNTICYAHGWPVAHYEQNFSLSKFVGYDSNSDVNEEENKTVVWQWLLKVYKVKDEEYKGGGDCDGESVCRWSWSKGDCESDWEVD